MVLLIDNCSLLHLIYAEGYSQALIELENRVNSGQVTLLTHPLILEEWATHRDKDKDRKLKKLLAQPGKKELSNPSSLLPSQIQVTTSHLELQFKQVDKLLQGAELLQTPETITNEFAKRYRDGKAPLHAKRKSLNDWEIIGSAALYCERNGISYLNFISYNHTDFAAADDMNHIHPDIQERFRRVAINYYRETQQFILELNNTLLPQHFLSGKLLRNEKYSYKSSVKKTELDSLYYLFKDIHEEVAFVPVHQLIKFHPFSKSAGSYTYYSVFTVDQVRDELVDFFEHIKVTNSATFQLTDESHITGIHNGNEKIDYVLKRLTANLIFNLQSAKGRKKLNIHYAPREICDCFKCSFWQFDFVRSMQALVQTEESLDSKLKRAYYYYKLGNFSSAAIIYEKALPEAYNQKKFFYYFLCQYNLRHLGHLLDGPLRRSELSQEKIDEFKSIDPIEECVKLKSYGNYDLMDWIADGAFFNEAFDNIVDEATKIETNYYAYLKGGWSCDSHVWKLIQEFAVLDSFINNNTIIYDAYNNFDRLFAQVVKGLFASHAMHDTGNSALENFDDYWVGRFIIYGDKDVFFRYYNRYQLKALIYKPSGDNKDKFITVAKNLLTNGKTTLKTFIQFRDRSNYRFTDHYQQMIENLLALGSILTLNTRDINRLAKYLLTFIKSANELNHQYCKSIAGFISYRGKLFNPDLLDDYASFFAKRFEKYETDILNQLIKSYPHKGLPQDLTDLLLSCFFSNDKNLQKFSSHGLIFGLSSRMPDKALLADQITASLEQKFDFSLYYQSVMDDIISCDENRIFALMEEIKLDQKNYDLKSVLSNKPSGFIRRFDQILNIIFKYNMDTSTAPFEKFRNYNDYYRWILDIENFDYTVFKINWVAHYGTKSYYKAMAKSPKLKKIVIVYLNGKPEARMEKPLMELLSYQDVRLV